MRSDAVIAIIVLVVGVAVFGAVLVHAAFYAPEAESAAPIASSTPYAGATSGATFSANTPVRLVIPALNINANVQHVGISYAGNVMVPSNFTDAAWYRGSAEPGQQGMAVIDGHVDNGLGLAGVFKHLTDIKVGDDIYNRRSEQHRSAFCGE
ncbi:MAG: class F sortase [Minisyncoccia bacterium]